MRAKLRAAAALGMTGMALGAAGIALPAQAAGYVTFYESRDMRGRAFSTSDIVENFGSAGFNDRASSAVNESGRNPQSRPRSRALRTAWLRRLTASLRRMLRTWVRTVFTEMNMVAAISAVDSISAR